MTYVSKKIAKAIQKDSKKCSVCGYYFCSCQICLEEWLPHEKIQRTNKNNTEKREEWESA